MPITPEAETMPHKRSPMVIDLTDDARQIVEQISKNTGLPRKEIISRVITSFGRWDDVTRHLVLELIPPSLADDETFWKKVRAATDKGIERCRRKLAEMNKAESGE